VYCYYGLNKVEVFWEKNEKLGYKFCLDRLPGQKEVACNELRETKNVYFFMKISLMKKKVFLYEKQKISHYPSALVFIILLT